MPELWYNDKDACEYDHKTLFEELKLMPEQKKAFDIIHNRTEGNRGVFVEEKIII